MYDYIIVGAGPTGLTLAYCFAKYGKKCLLVDKNSGDRRMSSSYKS